MAVGYTASSSAVAPDIRYVGRLSIDPLNQLPQTETTMLPSVTRSVQTGNCGSSACTRWGDYSAMTVDPVDDCTFWHTNMYFPVQGTNWVTRIGSFKFPTCSTFTDDPLQAGVTTIKAVHVVELRQRIDAQRVRFGLGVYPWVATITAGTTGFQAAHITELRTALAEAYGAAGRTPPPTYTDPSLGAGMVVQLAHIAELRAAVVAIE